MADEDAELLYSKSMHPPEEKRLVRATLKSYLPAIACAVTPLLCYIFIRPYAEIGMGDDWSYIKMVQVLAQTGHIAYNGWETPMLGWQLFFGAFLVKLFGFSFTVVRFCSVIEAAATAFLPCHNDVRSLTALSSAGVCIQDRCFGNTVRRCLPLHVPARRAVSE
jgi:hypothetical protein